MLTKLQYLLDPDKKSLAHARKEADKVMALKSVTADLSDEQLLAKTTEFKQRLADGQSLNSLLPEAYAVVCEAATRVLHETPFYEQIIGAVILHEGDIAEMKTGEGKTLTSIMPVYLHSLEGRGVHVVTVNEYLAARDSEWMGAVYRFLGCTVGLNLNRLTASAKREVYKADITYTFNSELGFDYLRDNMVIRKEDRVLRPLVYALVDEVDSILVDESRTPLIISGGGELDNPLYVRADLFVKGLKKNDFEIDLQKNACYLTDSGIQKAERYFNVSNLYDAAEPQLVHHVKQALRANHMMKRDVEYMVDGDEIALIDEFTGRKMEGREYSDGLHQAVQAKEGISIKNETLTLATITYQNFFRLYDHLCGMTGTAKTEEVEFLTTYNMRVICVPTHRPVVRTELPDRIFASKEEKFNALVDTINELHAKGQPLLVGTLSVETSEMVSELLKKRRLEHVVLNAKNHAAEAAIIARAGQRGVITIATNMAGRGTDIKLSEGVAELGGLAVLGTERHESKRIDNQLRGRSGRQGDPGLAQFFVSLEDDLILKYSTEYMQDRLEPYRKGKAIGKEVLAFVDKIQDFAVNQHFDARKNLLEYDDVLRIQREAIYDWRNQLLDTDDMLPTLTRCADTAANALFAGAPKRIEFSETAGWVVKINEIGIPVDGQEIKLLAQDDHRNGWVSTRMQSSVITLLDFSPEVPKLLRTVLLRIIDQQWMDHVRAMNSLQQGIHLRSYANTKPAQAYQEEGMNRFNEMNESICFAWLSFCFHVELPKKENS